MNASDFPDFRALAQELVDAYVWCIQEYIHNIPEKDALVLRARAALATQTPELLRPIPVSERLQQMEDLAADAVAGLRYIEQSHGRLYGVGWDRVYEKADRHKPALATPPPEPPTNEELLELMPETMRDEFSYAAKVCSDATGGQVKPGIFRVVLNATALDFARAALERWGR